MIEWIVPSLIGLLGGLVGAVVTYWLSLRQDKVARRRERIVAHLIEAYRNLESSVHRNPMSKSTKERLETSVAAIFLFGSKDAAEEAKKFAENAAKNQGNLTQLLKVLRRDLRAELGLPTHDVEMKILRFEGTTGQID